MQSVGLSRLLQDKSVRVTLLVPVNSGECPLLSCGSRQGRGACCLAIPTCRAHTCE